VSDEQIPDDFGPDFGKLPDDRSRQRAVPAGRVARLGTFGRLVGGVAGGSPAVKASMPAT
jgi:hypothetical protein